MNGEPKLKKKRRVKYPEASEIPLPPPSTGTVASSSSTVQNNDDEISEKDYLEKDFLIDKPDRKGNGQVGFSLSNRIVVCSYDGQNALLNRVGSTKEQILEDFKNRVVNHIRAGKKSQIDVPHIEITSNHTKCSCGKAESESENSDESSEEEEDENDDDDDEDEDEDEDEEDDKDDNEEAEEKNIEEKVKKERERLTKIPISKLEIDRKRSHPNVIHPDVCFNEKGLANDGAVCRCSIASRTKGLRHGYYSGEDSVFNCDQNSDNREEVYHYLLRVVPFPAEKQISKTVFQVAGEEYEFEGFSLLTHKPLSEIMPRLPLSRWSQEYEFYFILERLPDNCFTIAECDILYETIFHDIFEMLDFDLRSKYHKKPSCPVIHLMPRFVTKTGNFVKLMTTKGVMAYILNKYEKDFFEKNEINRLLSLDEDQFHRQTNRLKQNILVKGDQKPCALRIDGFERDIEKRQIFLIHNTVRPTVYSTVNISRLQYLERRLNRQKHLACTSGYQCDPVVTEKMNAELEELRNEAKQMRILRLRLPTEGYRACGFFPDTVAHILMCISAIHHVRYQQSLTRLEEHIGYKFKNRSIVELAMTHSSFQNYYGTTSDHAKNLISNCGYRRKYVQEERKDKKKGIVNLLNIMSSTGTSSPTAIEMSPILHNERLEYLGDAVVEMITTSHLFFMLPHHNEGGLATYRTSLVQNRNLATLAKNLRIDEFLQFAHGIELCHEADFRHALANTFEALIGAIYIDGGIEHCDRVFSNAMYHQDEEMKKIWDHVNEHELKREDPMGDRHLAISVPTLNTLRKLEESIGIEFNNIRLLAKALTRRSVPLNELTRGHNQRLEWLGDTVLQLIVTDYLYRNFPYHHEGHMSLLRTSLVSNQTQSKICEDLGFMDFVIKTSSSKTVELRTKDKADIVESFIGALYVDRGFEHCRTFVRICFLPRLSHFINNDKWNDPKSHLQQWCLTLRDANNPNPQIPEYRVVRVEGPTNTRIYTVAVYFRNKKLAIGDGANVHTAELKAAENALAKHEGSNFDQIKQIKRRKRRDRRKKIDNNQAPSVFLSS